MVKMGLIDPKVIKLPETPSGALKWEDNPDREWDAMAMAVHAAMIDRMDQGIGRIVNALKQTGELDNTLIQYPPGISKTGETRAFKISRR